MCNHSYTQRLTHVNREAKIMCNHSYAQRLMHINREASIMCNHSYTQRLMHIKQAGQHYVQPFIHTKIDAYKTGRQTLCVTIHTYKD